MRANQIMTRKVISVTPDTSVLDAANTTFQQHISGLPVGIVAYAKRHFRIGIVRLATDRG